MKYVISFVLLFTLCTTVESRAATVPCSKLHVGSFQTISSCQSPFMEGIVDGQWIGLVLHFTGGNKIDKATVFSFGNGGGAPMTFNLRTISYKDAFGWTGDMDFRFANGKLWVIYPDRDYYHQAHFGFTRVNVEQYGLYGPEFEVEKRAVVPMPGSSKGNYPSNATISAVLQRQ